MEQRELPPPKPGHLSPRLIVETLIRLYAEGRAGPALCHLLAARSAALRRQEAASHEPPRHAPDPPARRLGD